MRDLLLLHLGIVGHADGLLRLSKEKAKRQSYVELVQLKETVAVYMRLLAEERKLNFAKQRKWRQEFLHDIQV